MQTDRRRNPYPLTWHIPAGIAVVIAGAALYGVHAGRGAATWLAGHGWTWPRPAELLASIPAVLAGDASAGLTPGTLPEGAVASVTVCVVVVEVLLAGVVGLLGVVGWRTWGGGRVLGTATRQQAETILGLSRLHANRHIIRPDLYPQRRSIGVGRLLAGGDRQGSADRYARHLQETQP